jgi:hypothetical protein
MFSEESEVHAAFNRSNNFKNYEAFALATQETGQTSGMTVQKLLTGTQPTRTLA